MASPNPTPLTSPLSEEDQADRRAGFELLFSMRGTFHDLYERFGGVEAVIRDRHGPDEDIDPA